MAKKLEDRRRQNGRQLDREKNRQQKRKKRKTETGTQNKDERQMGRMMNSGTKNKDERSREKNGKEVRRLQKIEWEVDWWRKEQTIEEEKNGKCWTEQTFGQKNTG